MSDSVIPWTVAHQAPLSRGFPRQEYWSGLPFPSLGDLPKPGIKLESPALAGGFFTTESPEKSPTDYSAIKKNGILPFAAKRMDLKGIMVSEISQRKTNTI